MPQFVSVDTAATAPVAIAEMQVRTLKIFISNPFSVLMVIIILY